MAKAPSHLQWIELSRRALGSNIEALARFAGKRRAIAVSVKANAYGHGLPQIAAMLQPRDDVAYLTVHSLEEAIVCRHAGWTKKIMMVGPLPPENLEAVFEHDLEPVVFSRETLTALGRLAGQYRKKLRTHLKLETGTNRQGISEKEIKTFASIYRKYTYLGKPYGASTHFANIEDTTSHEYAQHQLDRFNKMVRLLARHEIRPTIRHTACSAALILFEKTRFDLVRPGISVYGHWPSKETYLSYRLSGGDNDIFTPVLSWCTRITQLKDIPEGSFVGYGCTYRTTTPTRLAVLPIGYYDGYSRSISNAGYVLIRGKRAPIRGRICMNLMMVDVTNIKGVRLGETAVLIGTSGRETLTAERLADWSHTINYEILSRLSQATPRKITR